MTHVLATTLLHDTDPQVRRSAARALEHDACVDDDERTNAIESLVKALGDPHVAVQEAAMASLVTFEPCQVATHVLPVLHGTVQQRNLAVEVIQHLGPATLPILFRASADADEHVRKYLVDIIGHIGGGGAVDGLLGLIHDPSPNVRAAVIESLGHVGDDRVVSSLIEMTQDPEEWVVFSAINALGNLKNNQAVPKLQELLSVEESAIRCAVVEALGKIGDPQVLPDLLIMLPTAQLPLRHLLFVTIIELVDERAEVFQREELKDYLFTELVQALNTRDPDVQLAALHGLRLLGNARATSALLRFLEVHRGGEEEIESAVLNALTHIGDEKKLLQAAQIGSEHVALVCIEALSTRHVTEAVAALGELVVQSENREIRLAALAALNRIGIDADSMAPIVRALDDQSGYVRAEAARIVNLNHISGAVKALWKRIDCEPYTDVVVEQVRAIINLDAQEGTKTLQRLLEHQRPEVRQTAIAYWPEVDHSGVRALFEHHMQDPDWRVRLAIVERLSAIHDDRILEMLIRSSGDAHSYVRQAAVQGLGQYPAEIVCPTLRAAMAGDPDIWVRTRAVEQLVTLHDVDSCSLLIQHLNDAPVPLQVAIVKALGTFGDRSMVEVLQEMQHHKEPELKEAAKLAIRQLMVAQGQAEVPA